MTPNPILKVLSTLSSRRVQYLLMGGQACVFYGAAEFSRDTDVAILAAPDNLARLTEALGELQADCIAVPPFAVEYLHRGHAIHFRCRHPEARDMRVDVMAVMRGVAPFDQIWPRRTAFQAADGTNIDVMGLEDLVRAKKTQRDKDWLMLRRLVEAHYAAHRDDPTPGQVAFWLQEGRTSPLLTALAGQYPECAHAAAETRPLLASAIAGDEAALTAALREEENREREADRAYWQPLKKELEQLRHQR